VLHSESAWDIVHLRYSARLQAASQGPGAPDCLHFPAAAHAALPPDHPWPTRVPRASLLPPELLPTVSLLNRYLCCHVRSHASVTWERALAPYAVSNNVSAHGRRRGSGPPMHLNPLRGSLSMRSPHSHSCGSLLRSCTPLPLCPPGPSSWLSLCALGLPAAA
jgi:hypothetical protein